MKELASAAAAPVTAVTSPFGFSAVRLLAMTTPAFLPESTRCHRLSLGSGPCQVTGAPGWRTATTEAPDGSLSTRVLRALTYRVTPGLEPAAARPAHNSPQRSIALGIA